MSSYRSSAQNLVTLLQELGAGVVPVPNVELVVHHRAQVGAAVGGP